MSKGVTYVCFPRAHWLLWKFPAILFLIRNFFEEYLLAAVFGIAKQSPLVRPVFLLQLVGDVANLLQGAVAALQVLHGKRKAGAGRIDRLAFAHGYKALDDGDLRNNEGVDPL